MQPLLGEHLLMRMHIGEAARHKGQPLYRALVDMLRRHEFSGATVLASMMSVGVHREVHDRRSEYTGYDTSLVIECIDRAERIDAILPVLEEMLPTGLVTLERAKVILYRSGHGVDLARRGIPSSADARPGRFPNQDGATMHGAQGSRVLMRIHIGGDDRFETRPLFEAIVDLLRRRDVAGATVFRGVLGFGAHARLHRDTPFALSDDLPYVIECIDVMEKIESVLPELDTMIGGGVITLEQVNVVLFRTERPRPTGDR